MPEQKSDQLAEQIRALLAERAPSERMELPDLRPADGSGGKVVRIAWKGRNLGRFRILEPRDAEQPPKYVLEADGLTAGPHIRSNPRW